MLVNKAGGFYRNYPFWDAATHAPPERLRAQLALLPMLAAEQLVHAAKDISMGGITRHRRDVCRGVWSSVSP